MSKKLGKIYRKMLFNRWNLEAQKVRLIPIEFPTTTKLNRQLIQTRKINDSPLATEKSAARLSAEPVPLPQARDQQTSAWMRSGINCTEKDSFFASIQMFSPSDILQCSESISTQSRTVPYWMITRVNTLDNVVYKLRINFPQENLLNQPHCDSNLGGGGIQTCWQRAPLFCFTYPLYPMRINTVRSFGDDWSFTLCLGQLEETG